MLTGAIILPLLILFILKGSIFLFTCLISLLSFLGLAEFYAMALPGRKGEGLAASVAGALPPFALLGHDLLLPLLAATLLFLFFAIVFLFRITDVKKASVEISFLFMGFLYVPFLLGHFVALRALPNGVQWVFLVMVIIMSGDTFAYYLGSRFGKHKLYPAVSPNKSVEGSAAGMAGSIVGAFVAKAVFFPGLPPFHCIMVALILGSLGQLGDLFESLMKRSFGIKDSGSLLPGHGGILDRLDSLLFSVPVAFYYARFLFR